MSRANDRSPSPNSAMASPLVTAPSATLGFVARPRAPVATLVVLGAAGATWAKLARRVAAFVPSGHYDGQTNRVRSFFIWPLVQRVSGGVAEPA